MEKLHPNLILINTFFEEYSTNNIEGIRTVLAEDIKWHIPGKHPLSGTKTGVDEVLRYFQQLNKGSFKAEPIVMGVNDSFVIDCHRNWSNIDNEENLDNMSCLLWKIENNKIIEVHNFPENQHVVDLFFSKLYSQS
ncbi:MAG: nuclear transport factor 2 family protein [Chitinophagaceae bacterium]